MSIQQLMSDRPELLPALTLAYIGDGVYELQVRKHLLRLGIYKVDDLHKRAISLVCANTQARLAAAIQEQLTPFEVSIMHRGRNAKGQHNPKGASVATYHLATGLETLIGYWYLAGAEERLVWFFQRLWQYEKENQARLNQESQRLTLEEEEQLSVDLEEEFRAELADLLQEQLAAVQKK